LAQMSEFSLVIASLGLASGHISKSTMGLVTYTMLLLAVVSSHAIKENHRLYALFRKVRGRGVSGKKPMQHAGHGAEIVVLGCHRGARAFLNALGIKNPTPKRSKSFSATGLLRYLETLGTLTFCVMPGLRNQKSSSRAFRTCFWSARATLPLCEWPEYLRPTRS
jgi:hypothetical protein